MYSKEEFKQLKKDFWTKFGQFTQLKRERLGLSKKWMLYKTGLKGLELKFDLDENSCFVALEIDNSSPFAHDYFNKIQILKTEITSQSEDELLEDIIQKAGRIITRYYFERSGLNIKNQAHWPEIFSFYYSHMIILETFVLNNKDVLETH
jgi:hypothetical protein